MTYSTRIVVTKVATAAGDLRALIHHPNRDHPLPGVVLVDGAGDGTADGWGRWPAAVADCGAVVLAHDKPGCGGSPGDWREQTLEDRAVAWVDERARRLGAGEAPASIISAQRAYADRPWFAAASEHYDDPAFLSFVSRNFSFDPATVLPRVRCRVFAAFSGADTSVPAAAIAVIVSQLLPANPQHALAIFPGGDHNLFITEWDENTPLASQLAPGFMPMLDTWLNTASEGGRVNNSVEQLL